MLQKTILILVAILLCNTMQAQLSPKVEAKIDRTFAFLEKNSPGYAIGVIKDQNWLFQKGYGLANLEYQIPIDGTTAFNIASLSKQFTAACVAMLILDKELSLEDYITQHIPNLPATYASIQVKHLMYMTSGLKEYYECERANGMDWSGLHFFSMDTAIVANLQHGQLNFKPGSQWRYNNINFMLLARIVENISKQTLAQFAHERLFQPLGMENTRFNDNILEIIPNRADGYVEPVKSETATYFKELGYIPTDVSSNKANKYLQVRRNSPHYGGSGIYTTLQDLAKWDQNWYTQQVGGQEFYELMHHRMQFEHSKNNDAFGLVFGDFNGEEIVWYDGRTFGFRAYMMRFPEHKMTVICLSNLETGPAPRSQTDKIVDILLNEGIIQF